MSLAPCTLALGPFPPSELSARERSGRELPPLTDPVPAVVPGPALAFTLLSGPSWTQDWGFRGRLPVPRPETPSYALSGARNARRRAELVPLYRGNLSPSSAKAAPTPRSGPPSRSIWIGEGGQARCDRDLAAYGPHGLSVAQEGTP